MTSGIRTVIYPVKDLAQAKALYTKLAGVAPIADQPSYVGFKADGQETGLAPNRRGQGMTGPLAYWHVDDINQSLQQLVDAGAEVQQAVRDVGGGKLVASVRDPDGNPIGLLQSG